MSSTEFERFFLREWGGVWKVCTREESGDEMGVGGERGGVRGKGTCGEVDDFGHGIQ